jgi:hypothetical protein
MCLLKADDGRAAVLNCGVLVRQPCPEAIHVRQTQIYDGWSRIETAGVKTEKCTTNLTGDHCRLPLCLPQRVNILSVCGSNVPEGN